MRNIIIWGAGRIGELAYIYYKNSYNIISFIDSDSKKWGKLFYNIPINNPQMLLKNNFPVVIAVKTGSDEIRKKIINDYHCKNYYFFKVEEVKESSSRICEKEIEDRSIILKFSGGLGNQMFQYAFLKAQSLYSKKIYANISSYDTLGKMPFQLIDVFNTIKMYFVNNESEQKLINRVLNMTDNKKFLVYKEPLAVTEIKEKEADMNLLQVNGGIFQGHFQTYKFAELIKEELLKDFQFNISVNSELVDLAKKIEENNFISIHIRRGDYLLNHTKRYYGNICTEEYYMKAIDYISEKCPKSNFCFFSDDIEWVKKNFVMLNAIYIERNMLSNYEDWYDMYLMSMCKHNIIANSTFSWWGAWLNQNPEKIVIAPSKWINGCDYKDIYPPEWICL